MSRKIFLLFPIVVLSCSCANNQQTRTSILKVLNDSLTISTARLKTKNDSLYKILEQKLRDGKATQATSLWFAKAQYLQYRTAEIYKYLDTSISNLKTSPELNSPDTLYKKLNFYKDKILRIDPDIYIAINRNSAVITHYLDSVKQYTNERFDLLFFNKSKQEQLLILNQTSNNIKNIENETLLFCNSKIN